MQISIKSVWFFFVVIIVCLGGVGGGKQPIATDLAEQEQ